jgi:hypothetical protein
MQVVSEEPVAPRQLQPRTPRDLETICLKCLEKSAAKRYALAENLADDLRRFLGGEPITARPTSRLTRAAKWARRRPAVAALLGALAAALAAGGTGMALLYAQAVTARGDAEWERDQAREARSEADRRNQESRRNLYASQMTLAQIAEDLRRLEWYHFRTLSDAESPLIDDCTRLTERKAVAMRADDIVWGGTRITPCGYRRARRSPSALTASS